MIALQGAASGAGLEVDGDKGAARTVLVGRGTPYAVSNVTGIIGAALVANSSVFGMRLSAAASVVAYIERVRLSWTTLVAFTTPLTAGRRLALFRGAGGSAAWGGTAIASASRKDINFGPISNFDTANSGAMGISTTGALTVTGITFEAEPIRTMPLVHVGNAGNFMESIFEFAAGESHPIVLRPGQSLAVRNPVAMDAAGTWQLAVSVDWHEVAPF